MTNRKIITEQVDDMSMWEFEGTIQDVLLRIEDLYSKYGPDARLDYNPHFYYPYESVASPRYEVTIKREETDAEVKQRLTQEAEHNRKREEAERAEFERLAKKYGAK